ncbi:MAG: autotransporter outer membrane beta-barrel domain-containing protein, partial [Chthoniobacteraceae bacterium]
MKLLKPVRLLSLGVIALLSGGVEKASAHDDSGWEITGTNSSGQTVIVSTGTQVGQLNAYTFPATTSGSGGNYVTLNANTIASANSGATIEFDGPNNVFVNNGTIQGPNEDDVRRSVFANTAMGFYAGSGSLFNQQVYNNGNIYGGDGSFEGCGVKIADTGLAFLSNAGIYNITINNAGGIFGGGSLCYSGSSPLDGLGDGVLLYDANEVVDISGVSIVNTGIIAGGSNVMNANVIGTGVTLVSAGSITNFAISNGSTGSITGGNYDTRGFVNGSGVVVLAGFEGNSSAAINGGSLNNAGIISGGNHDSNYNLRSGPMVGNVVGSGVVFEGANGVYNLTLANSGIISGGSFASGGNGGCYFGSVAGSGLAIFDKNSGEISGDINTITLNNSGLISGGMCSSDAYIVGSGVGIVGLGNVLNVAVTNTSTGSILGGNDNFGNEDENLGAVVGSGLGIVAGAGDEDTSYHVSNIVIKNAGTIAGGNNNDEGIIVGSGIGIAASDGVYGINIVNLGGNILGGNNNEDGTIVGSGIGIYDDNDNGKDINGVTVTNTGLIAGGTNNRYSDLAGVGVGVLGSGNVSNVLINNAGTIKGGNSNTYDADFGGEGIVVASYDGKVSGVTINNIGSILGGNGTGRNEGSNGIEISGESISHTSINNFGLISGGNGGNGMVGCYYDYGQDGGIGILVSADRCDPDLNIINSFGASILGGNGGTGTTSGGNGGDAINIGMQMGSNISITNYGTIRGGNAGAGGYAGQGIRTVGDNITINNWGNISAGSGLSDATVSGYPAVAVSVNGNNNTINLNGHSTVNGTLEGITIGNNVLNLNFTGLSPTAIAAVKSELTAQGWYPGDPTFSGTFNVRGLTYYVDPLTINLGGLTAGSYQVQGFTPNQKAIGASLDSITFNPTGGLLALYNAIDASGDVPYALEALSPQPYQIYGDIAEATTNFMTLSIDERLNNLRDGSESIDVTGIGGGSDHTTTAGYDKDGKTVVVPDAKSLQKHWGFFAEGSGLFASVDAHGGDLSNAGFTTSGLILGVDGKVNDHLVLGLLFNYDYTVADLDGVGSKANVQTLGGGVYAGYHNNGWYGNGLAAFGSNDYNSNRNIFFPGFNSSALGDTHGDQESVNIDGGYDFHLLNDKLTVGPIAGLQYVHLNVDGFNEAGAGAADLAVGGQDVNSLRSRLGFRADYHAQIAKEVAFATEFRAAWQHEFMDDNRAIDGAFIGSSLGGFAVETTKPQRDAALVGVGVNFTVRDTMTLFFDYDVQAGQESYLEQSVKG